MKKVRKKIKIKGIVQGVGFRPFIYRLASKQNLVGWVNNNSQGVIIDIEGESEKISSFLSLINSKSPPLAKIDSIELREVPLKGYDNFSIKQSSTNTEDITLISSDIVTCLDCQEEVKNFNNHRYRYPFTNCTNCGPRYSIIEDLPYDRAVTTMKDFKMCDSCREEYEDPSSRRFHAQPNACPKCGPQLWLTDNLGSELAVKDPLKQAIKLLKQEKLLAIKGLGGFHLACDGKSDTAIKELRARKRRPDKPLAVMMRDREVVKKYCYLNSREEEILTGIRRPILLLKRKNNSLPANISVDNNYLGVMLPYTPLHELLFEEGLEILVMTSANLSGLPLEYRNQGSLDNLKEFADYFLLHDREIKTPVDDSVSRIILGQETLIRRGRGYAPLAIKFAGLKETLACGAELKNSFAIAKKGYLFLSQHLGNISKLESYQNYQEVIKHLKEIYQINPELIAYDLHPEYLTTKFAQSQGGQKVGVQHHHAHLVSCMVENEVSDRVIGLAFDGTGLGIDGRLWGGEFLLCDYTNFKRVGHLEYVKMPGGEQSIKEPWRMAISYLYEAYGDDIELFTELIDIDEERIKKIVKLIKADINSPQTSSMGRLFDAVGVLVALGKFITYEAQVAIKLEASVISNEVGEYDYQIKNNDGHYIVNTTSLIKSIVNDIKLGVNKGVIARKFHNTVIDFSVAICKLVRRDYKINSVALSGGVFQNKILLEGIYQQLIAQDFKVYFHKQIPSNDGGLAVGQLVIANYQKGAKNDVHSNTRKSD
ncbi:carbamoyltransferase HypF [Orenia marismortui]|uniref:Carbamoyltransferase n=1 Tax=Orenia marismortui TaxID=46469 RepID=A0A4R8H047_9FIRM|nr:carbamoyltransferase HypF [Orenia marismortui]TDX52397.1 hydrogenase maturation carbamoyltransferase HypF [Orenia marismortui]